MTFLVVLSGKMIFLFPETMVLFFRRKIKNDLSQKKKKKRKNDIFFKRPEKTAFPKKIVALEYDLSVWYVFFGQKMKDDYFQEINGNMIFSVYTNMILRFCKKILKMILYRKNALKEDWHSRLHPRNSSSDLLYFYGDLHRRFHILLSGEKKKNKTRNLIYRIEISLLFQFIWLEIFCNKESSILCTIQPSKAVFRGVHERQFKKSFAHYETGYTSKNIITVVNFF